MTSWVEVNSRRLARHGLQRATGVAARGRCGDGGGARPGDVGGGGVARPARAGHDRERTWPPRCGRTGRWSRPSVREGRSTCCRRPTCRGGWRRSARCRGRAATPRASGCCPTRPTRSWRRSTRRCGRRTAPPTSSTRTSPRRAAPWAAEESMAAFGGFWPRWRLALGPAAVRGVLCFGPNRGRKVTYASPSRWLSDLSLPEADEAQLDLLSAYLTAYGPATAGAPGPVAGHVAGVDRRALPASRPRGGRASRGSRRGCCAATRRSRRPSRLRCGCCPTSTPSRSARSREPCCSPAGRRSGRWPGAQAGNFPVLLLDGVVGGVWHQKRSGKRLAVTVEPLGRLTTDPARPRSTTRWNGSARSSRRGPELTVGPGDGRRARVA